jgi:hypothetical protein
VGRQVDAQELVNAIVWVNAQLPWFELYRATQFHGRDLAAVDLCAAMACHKRVAGNRAAAVDVRVRETELWINERLSSERVLVAPQVVISAHADVLDHVAVQDLVHPIQVIRFKEELDDTAFKGINKEALDLFV